MRGTFSTSRHALLALALCCLIPSGFLAAQEKAPPAQDKGAALQAQARTLWDSEQWTEAEKAYLDALKVHEQQLSVTKGDDATLLRWCQCRNELGELQGYMQKTTDMKTLSAATLAYLKQLIPHRAKEPAFRLELARTHLSLSKAYQYLQLSVEAADQLSEAVALLKKLAEDYPTRADFQLALTRALHNQGGALMELGRYQDAETAYREGLRLTAKLCTDAPTAPEPVLQAAILQQSLAFLMNEAGRQTEALDTIRATIRLLAKLEVSHPQQPEFWYLLPELYGNLALPRGSAGNDAEMQAARREAQRLSAKITKMPEAVKKWLNDPEKLHASVQSIDLQRLALRQTTLEKLLEHAVKDAKASTASPLQQQRLAFLKGFNAIQMTTHGQPEEAQKEFQQAITLMEALTKQYPDIPANRYVLADLHITFGMTFLQKGKFAEGNKMLGVGVALLDKLAADYPKVPQFRMQSGDHQKRVALILSAQGEDKEAIRFYTAALRDMKQLTAEHPACPKFRKNHVMSYMTMFKLQYQTKAYPEAEATMREAIEQWRKVIADFPATLEFQTLMASNLGMLGQYYLRRNQYEEAEKAYREVLPINQRLIKDHPQRADYYVNMAIAYLWLAQLREKQERSPEAVDCYTQALALWESALKLSPRHQEWLSLMRESVHKRASVYFQMGKLVEYQNDTQRFRDLGDALEAPPARLIRIEYRAKQGDLGRALKEAEDLYENANLKEAEWCELACCYATLTTKMRDASQRDALAVRAVESLRHAVEQGYARARLCSEPRLLPVMQRDDFKRLCQEK